MCALVKTGNLIKWRLNINGNDRESCTFQIRNSKCMLKFRCGDIIIDGDREPLSLLIVFDEKNKLVNPPTDITVRVILPSETVSHSRQTITGEFQQLIWSSFDYGLIGSWLTFEITIDDTHMNDKASQTPSYLNNRVLMEGIARDFSKMLKHDSGQDVEFILGDQTIKAHKRVLSCRSDVFASMLQSDMTEGRTGRVNIEDIDAEFFQEFLKCLYTGVLPTLTVDTAMKFYEVGDKYNVSSLKKQCADFLVDYLSSENVYDVLIFADRHSDEDIKRGAKDFMVKEKMPDSDEKWAEFCNQYPMLTIEVYRFYCKRLRSNEY